MKVTVVIDGQLEEVPSFSDMHDALMAYHGGSLVLGDNFGIGGVVYQVLCEHGGSVQFLKL